MPSSQPTTRKQLHLVAAKQMQFFVLAMTSLQRRQSRAIEKLLPGQVSFLKNRVECSDSDLLRADIRDGCFGHLVLILSTDTRKAQIEALIVSGLKRNDPNTYIPHH